MLKIFYDDQRHLVCTPYTVPMLHSAAKLLGLKRCWFHASPYPHYDLPKRWVADFGLRLDEQLLNLDVNGVAYEQVTPRQLLTIIKEGKHG
jgi:hypothetical protein